MGRLDFNSLQKFWNKIKNHVQTSLQGYAKTSDIPDTSNFVSKDENGDVTVESLQADDGITCVGVLDVQEGYSARFFSNDNSKKVALRCDDNGKLTLDGKEVATVDDIPSGGSGGGASIIDITDFPSAPSTTSIYRKWQVVKAQIVAYGQIITDGTMECEVVDTLPEMGNICYTGTAMYAYYQRADGEAYGYVDSNLSTMMSVPVGWYPAATLFGALGYTYNGMVYSIGDASSDGYTVLLTKKPHLYCFHNNGSTIEKSAIITNDNYEFDEATGTLTQYIIL